MREGGFDTGDSVPVNVGDEFTVKIEAVGEKGDGIAKKDGFVLFVPNTKEGEEVKIRVTKVLRKVGFADVVGKADSGSSAGDREEPYQAPYAPEESDPVEDTEDFGEEKEESEEEIPEPPKEEKEFVEDQAEEVKKDE